ncbi:MAG: ricin-type beta-trefoil lectin domain protein [Candidatus Solibacter usitatus]|nr:ricin-type beta-trefoil lectin domain protein [Candidatus Solibacter usitatus]
MNRLLRISLLLCLGIVIPGLRQAAADTIQIQSPFNNYCFAVPNADYRAGNTLVMWPCLSSPNALMPGTVFTATSPGGRAGTLQIGGKCLDAFMNTNPPTLGLWDCHGGTNQLWTINPATRSISNSYNGQCVAVRNADRRQGNGIVLWRCIDEPNQKWTTSLAQTPPPPAPAPVRAPAPVAPSGPKMTNASGEYEYCFGAVGKGCDGSGITLPNGRSDLLPLKLGCSNENGGYRNCWIVPGSIKHDNCCVNNSNGKVCGKTPETSACSNEWEMAMNDVANGRGWFQTIPSGPSDLSPVPSSRVATGETASTVKLCAPGGTNISEYHGAGFCCSGRFRETWWAPSIGNSMTQTWGVCADPGGYSLQSVPTRRQWQGQPPVLYQINTPPPPPSAQQVQNARGR